MLIRFSKNNPTMRATLAGALLIGLSAPLVAQEPADDPESACSDEHSNETAKVGQFTFKTYEGDEDGSCLQIVRGGTVLFQRTLNSPHGYTLGQSADKDSNAPAIANGTDITGRGHPDMIVAFNTGGAHCCSYHYVFELEPDFRLVATLKDMDDDLAHFEPTGKGTPYEYLTADWTFAYWPTCFSCSPSAPVILKFVDDGKGGSYHLYLDRMRRPAPTSTEWRQALKDARQAIEDGPASLNIGTTLWDTVLNLIYSGHSDLAFKFYDEAWPAEVEGKSDWMEDFYSRLKTSPYWHDLRSTIRNAPRSCASARPEPSAK
jgi:hypothetical protein